MHPANDRWRYNVTSSLVICAHTQNDPWYFTIIFAVLYAPSCYDWLRYIEIWLYYPFFYCLLDMYLHDYHIDSFGAFYYLKKKKKEDK